jgi:hypothetical protein
MREREISKWSQVAPIDVRELVFVAYSQAFSGAGVQVDELFPALKYTIWNEKQKRGAVSFGDKIA